MICLFKALNVSCLNTLLLAEVFENFRNICIETYEFDPANFFQLAG